MAENEPKSKLKRKKLSVEEDSLKTLFNSAPRKHHVAAKTRGQSWWSSPDLPATERLWASTLECFGLLPEEGKDWTTVPEFPPPLPVAEKSTRGSDEENWCDITREVPPLPPMPRHDYRGWSSDEPSTGSDLELKTSSEDGEQQKRLEPESRLEPETRLEQQKKKKEEEEEDLQLQSMEVEVPQQQDVAEEKKKVGEELQSCPMCLIVFPLGFTRLDRDGHLAQCLSEMNVDMNW